MDVQSSRKTTKQDLPYMVITSPEYFVGSDVAIIGDRGSFVVGTEGVSGLDLAGSSGLTVFYR